MNNNILINPYDLFNLTTKSTLKQLQKKYYKMALICHPDKGGCKNDMIIIHTAYIYIKEQLENCKNIKKYEEIEKKRYLYLERYGNYQMIKKNMINLI